MGWFGASWVLEAGTLRISVQTPEGTGGVLKLPGSTISTLGGKGMTVMVDGISTEAQAGTEGLVQLSGGNHTIVIS